MAPVQRCHSHREPSGEASCGLPPSLRSDLAFYDEALVVVVVGQRKDRKLNLALKQMTSDAVYV